MRREPDLPTPTAGNFEDPPRVEERAAAPVTTAIIATCVALSGLSFLWEVRGAPGAVLRYMGANDAMAIRRGEVERLLASAFLHDGLVHLFVNMYALWILGRMLERLIGAQRFLLLYGACALSGAIASAWLRPRGISVGASGAIWGLMAAVITIRLRPRDLLPGRPRSSGPLWGLLAINVGLSFLPGVDLLAHFGGGIVGALLASTVLTRGLIPVLERHYPSEAERVQRPWLAALSGAVAVAMALSLAVALWRGQPWRLGSRGVALSTSALGLAH